MDETKKKPVIYAEYQSNDENQDIDIDIDMDNMNIEEIYE